MRHTSQPTTGSNDRTYFLGWLVRLSEKITHKVVGKERAPSRAQQELETDTTIVIYTLQSHLLLKSCTFSCKHSCPRFPWLLGFPAHTAMPSLDFHHQINSLLSHRLLMSCNSPHSHQRGLCYVQKDQLLSCLSLWSLHPLLASQITQVRVLPPSSAPALILTLDFVFFNST